MSYRVSNGGLFSHGFGPEALYAPSWGAVEVGKGAGGEGEAWNVVRK